MGGTWGCSTIKWLSDVVGRSDRRAQGAGLGEQISGSAGEVATGSEQMLSAYDGLPEGEQEQGLSLEETAASLK
jgi:hypothetical protein